MRNVFLIARREYLERVRTKSFMVMTVLIPLMMAGFTIGPGLLMNRMSHAARRLVVVASSTEMGEGIRQQLSELQSEQSKKAKEAKQQSVKRTPAAPPELSIDVDTNTSQQERDDLTQKVNSKQLDGVIWAADDALAADKAAMITRDVSSFIENTEMEQSVSEAVHRQALKKRGLSESEIDNVFKRIHLDVQNASGRQGADPQMTFIVAFVMVMILYMSVLLYGINVMRAILEEKTSRIMEVMLSIAQAKEMMAGKILGVGAVGLTQVVIWAAVAGVFTGGGLIAVAGMMKGVISTRVLTAFPVFYLLGYALYSTLCAAVGSMVNSEQEAQQLQFFVMIPLFVSLAVMISVVQFPSSPLAVWTSIFPFTAPLIMFVRIAVQPPPLWQIALSIGVMLVTIYGMILLCGRIYRVGVLMYGKRPTLPEIMKWIKYA
jgi:ABC-2 type transport system permease protein